MASPSGRVVQGEADDERRTDSQRAHGVGRPDGSPSPRLCRPIPMAIIRASRRPLVAALDFACGGRASDRSRSG